jgi:hypothetical protein
VACFAAGLESGGCFRQSFRVKRVLGKRVPNRGPREVQTCNGRGQDAVKKMKVEEAPRPAGPCSHAVVAYCFVFVARLKGRCGDQIGFCRGSQDGLRWAISSPGAILKGQRILRAGFLVGL